MARDDERRPIEQPPESNGVIEAIKVGSLIGAGALGFHYRSQIGSGIKSGARNVGEFAGTLTGAGVVGLARAAKFQSTMQDVKTFAGALHKGLDGRGVLSHIKNPSRFESRFNESLQYSIEGRARMTQNEFGGRVLSGEEAFQKMRTDLRMANHEVFLTHRMHNIRQDLKKEMPEEMKNGLDGVLDDNLIKNITPQKVSGFVDMLLDKKSPFKYKPNIKGKESRKKFEETLFENIKRYETKDSVGFQDQVKRNALKTAQKKIKAGIREGFIADHQNIDDMIARTMKTQGFQRATFEDLLMGAKGNLLKKASNNGKKRVESGGSIDPRFHSKISKMMNVDRRYRDLVADKNLWINAKGEMLDTNWMAQGAIGFATGFRDSVQIPFLRFNPLDLMHFTTWEGMRDAPKTVFKKMGSIDPALHGSVKEIKHPLAHNQDAAVGVLARGYVNTADGKVHDLLTGDIAKTDVYQASARFGLVPRAMAGMANLHKVDYGSRGIIGKIFDIGAQETDSIMKRGLTTITKFGDDEWGPNILNALKRYVSTNGKEGLSPESAYKLTFAQMESKTKLLSDDTVNYIAPEVKRAYGDIDIDLTKLRDEDEIISALGRIHEANTTQGSSSTRLESANGLNEQVSDMYLAHTRNKQQFLNNKRVLPSSEIVLPEWLSALDMQDTNLVSKLHDAKRLIQQHASKQLEYATMSTEKVTIGDLVQRGIKSGNLEANALREVNQMETLSTLRGYWGDVYQNADAKEEALERFTARVLDEKDPLSISVQGAMEQMNPSWAMGPGNEPPDYFGFVSTLSMNKAKGARWAIENYNKQTAAGTSPVSALLESVGAVISQPFAGRSNTGNVTTATLFPYLFAERLDNAVAQVGLGLSQKNRGSMQSILANQFGRRIVLPYMAYQQAVWADGVLGDTLSDTGAETYANMHEDVGHLKELLGFNDIGRQWSRVFAGGDQIAEMPIGRAVNFATFGLFDNKSGDEIREFYESGEVAVRKGRYWGIGSNTPYTGGKIDRYVPNWYRRMKSDYKFTDTMYGSESEYFANHWMPTLTNPLAPVRHFFLDPYHWEKKHEEDRPYPVTGGFSEIDQIPIIGSAINNTVGRVLKPRREHPDLEKAHRAYIEELNANITAQYEQASEGGMMMGMPAGGFNVVQGVPMEGEGIAGTGAPGFGHGGIAGVTPEQYAMMIGDTGGATGASRGQLAAINSMYSEIGGPSLGATGKNVRSLTALEDLRDPDVLADLSDIGTMYSASSTARDTFYSLTEIGGMYGFLTKTGIGWQESGRGMTLDQSSRMSSYSRAWWDMEMGGLGGQLSEIGRRYVPRDPNKSYWNPIKNTMPDWLPGSDYFIDFQHGDPYTKVANGEMRLPGKAYEKLYELHPDALGEYGTFDRFRILADVAPYSENYKFYRGMVSKMNQSGLLTDDMKAEYAEIREQVSNRKKKHRFYNRRFDNADVQYEDVTITRMLDATTFLTKEHPNNPIRMAGVKVKATDEESTAWLQQYVHEGAKVRIAVDADPLFRVRDDTYNTMHAVVYASKDPEGTMLPYGNKGQNVNFMLANRKSGGVLGTGVMGESDVSVHDDGSATATRALFSNDMVTVGKMWETLTHDILPSVPIVGTIADKFLQVRSPLELYKKQEIYGKAWRPWEEPFKGWIQPMMDSIASRHPLVGAAQGAGIGWLFAKKGMPKFYGTRIGAIIGGGAATARVFIEQGSKITAGEDGDTWLPQRRRDEREINEYFDKIKYVKYRGLYERARREAMRREGVDVEELINEHEERGSENKAKRSTLQSMKKWLSMNKKLGYGDKEAMAEQLDSVRASLNEIEADRPNQSLGQYSMLALRYKAEYESTLYGADENGDMTKIFRALPSKDREFFTEFMKAAPKEREEILRLVPKDQRRFYQAKWGMEVDKKESLYSYFNKHSLPGVNWEGWKPDKSLENYKIKVVQNEGLELTEFNFWADDAKRAENSNAKAIPMKSISSSLDITRLEKVLRGAGLTDVNVTMGTEQKQGENKISLAMNVMKDRSGEIITEINNNMGSLFS